MQIRRDPKYRHHKARNLAVVRIEGRDYYLGRFGTDESKLRYHRLLADWRAGLLVPANGNAKKSDDRADTVLSVAELAAKYWEFAKQYYRKDGKLTQPGIRIALRYLRETSGQAKAKYFGPRALKAIRERMIVADLSRRYVNDNIARIKRCFRWATEEELISGDVYQALCAVSSLASGRSNARETEPIQPVETAAVDATVVYLAGLLANMVRLQLLLACRPSEICQLRPCDVKRRREIWLYEPKRHKTQHRGCSRQITIGPRAQDLLLPYLRRDPHQHCFLSRLGKAYSTDGYRLAIARACQKADIRRWTPNQLRHVKATEVRARFGLEAAQVYLGHGSANVTQIYAERDRSLAEKVAREIG
jgi:integrase